MTETLTDLENRLKNPKFRRGFNRETLVVGVAEALCRVGGDEDTGARVKPLAEKLGMKRKKVKRMLQGHCRNMTLKQLADYATKLGCTVRVEFIPQSLGTKE